MLINLSNHPSKKWGELQMEAAIKQFGEVVDLEFPNIPPDADEEEVVRIAVEYGGRVINMIDEAADENPLIEHAIHLMGEQTFCFALMDFVDVSDYFFYASTTERNVIELDNGKKQTEFKFVRFRRYKSYYDIHF